MTQANADLLNVSVSPHIKSKKTTRAIMLDVIIALLPASVAATVLFGYGVLALLAVAVVFSVLGEYVFNKITKKPATVSDLSAVVTGIILALNVPIDLPLWQLALGSLVAICIVKGLFGGLGQNFANPAVTARIFLLISFSSGMASITQSNFADSLVANATSSATQLVSSATPLSSIGTGAKLPTITDMLLGNHGTSAVGETCIVALLVGAVYLLARKVISWHTPVCFIGSVYLLSLAVSGDATEALYLILSGGLIFGAIFMATDYATTPTSKLGQVVFGIGCGLMTFLIRTYGAYPEGVSLSILFMNILTPYIEKLCRRRALGGEKK